MKRPARLGIVIPKPRPPKPRPAPAPKRPRAIDALDEIDALASADEDDPIWLESTGIRGCLLI